MAKLTALKLFDTALLKGSKSAQELAPFIEFVNGNFDSIIRALRNQLTFGDNIKSQVIQAEVTQGLATAINLSNTSVLGAIPLRIDHPTDSLESYIFRQQSNGTWAFTPYFRLASATEKRSVTFLVLFN